jgi:PAS domain S-box-containing protein
MTNTLNDKIISCFYESSEDCVKVVDIHGILKSFNENGLKVMEIDNQADVIGKAWLSFWKGDLEIPAREAFAKAAAGEPALFEGFCPTLKGTMKYWTVSLVPILEDDGSVGSILITSKDTTKILELEKRIDELESEMSKLRS